MGCAQSKIDNEETVARCRNRKRHMKEAVASRNAFAAAHSLYAVALKHTGAALSEYGQGELGPFPFPASSSAAPIPTAGPAPPPPTISILPPPRPDDFSPPSPPPLQRSVSMPEIPLPKPTRKAANPAISEEEDEDPPSAADAAPPPPPKDPPASSHDDRPPTPPAVSSSTWDFFFPSDEQIAAAAPPPHFERSVESAPPAAVVEAAVAEVRREKEKERVVEDVEEEEEEEEEAPPPLVRKKPGGHPQRSGSGGAGKGKAGHVTASVNIVQMLNSLDDHFLRASESAGEVTKMLEATRLHYHSNFADNRGHIDHSARVMKVITWNRSFKGIPDTDDGKDDFDNEEWETHATILDKLLAWEKKLYDEVKAGELMKNDYHRKLAQVERLKKRNSNPEKMEKAKAAVSHMQTRLIVDMQSMDSTVSEIQRLRDEHLYVKLTALVDGMAKMWESMHMHHENQKRIVGDLRALDISSTPKETTLQHFERTKQLYNMSTDWHTHFRNLMNHQKEYIAAMENWLKLNVIPIESNLKEKVSSPPRIQNPHILSLVHCWQEQMDKLPYDLAQTAISSFAAVINSVMMQQQEELKQKQRCEELGKEFRRKERAFSDWCEKHVPAGIPSEEADQGGEGSQQNDAVAERRQAMELAKQKLEQEQEELRKLCRQVREKAVGSLKSHLPELFRAMTDFSLACSNMYKSLRSKPVKKTAPRT